MTKTEFLLTILIQYQPDKWWEQRKISIRGLLIDPVPILQTNITRTVWQTVRRITNEILGVRGLIWEGTQGSMTYSTDWEVVHTLCVGTKKNKKKAGYEGLLDNITLVQWLSTLIFLLSAYLPRFIFLYTPY